MGINKISVILILLSIIGCKKETIEKEIPTVKNDTTKIQKHQIDSTDHNKINGFTKESIVVSCGSGCALSYSPKSIKQIDNTIKVIFDVKMYEDDVLTDTYDETYIFKYNNSNKLDKIEKEGEGEDFFKTLIPDAQQSFLDFGNNLIINKSVDFSQDKNENKLSEEKNYNICELPFDFDNYYNTCYDNEKECTKRYPSYSYPENKNILDYYGINKSPTKFFLLPKINDFQPVICAYTDSDIEGYYLIIAKKGKLISSLKIAEMGGETINAFTITKEDGVELYSKKEMNDQKIIKKKYKIQMDGFIK
ncbi:hypothetical protein [Chryseobacterium sp.]|jgi:hypothetical protein|uniref:hypothetical protein n=1 Tax=Chryseobacterium sp. TaxID=1871047 RepID=UPI00284B46D2|nr:hypothetical protein [Chryseobacterium sp.]MDR3025165.1 hypothetical protein [Chryseobacterium sp.]